MKAWYPLFLGLAGTFVIIFGPDLIDFLLRKLPPFAVAIILGSLSGAFRVVMDRTKNSGELTRMVVGLLVGVSLGCVLGCFVNMDDEGAKIALSALFGISGMFVGGMIEEWLPHRRTHHTAGGPDDAIDDSTNKDLDISFARSRRYTDGYGPGEFDAAANFACLDHWEEYDLANPGKYQTGPFQEDFGFGPRTYNWCVVEVEQNGVYVCAVESLSREEYTDLLPFCACKLCSPETVLERLFGGRSCDCLRFTSQFYPPSLTLAKTRAKRDAEAGVQVE